MSKLVTFIDGPFELQKRMIPDEVVESRFLRTIEVQPIQPIREYDEHAMVRDMIVPVITYVIERIVRRSKVEYKELYIAYLEVTR